MCDFENFGMIVTEALSVGTPVIASLGTPWEELNIHRCGWWVNNDVDTLAQTIEKVLSHTSSGGACVNDVVAHVANSHLPFGGIGESGMGRYHGKESFYTFSHARAVLRNTTRLNPGIKFAPFAGKLPLIKRILR